MKDWDTRIEALLAWIGARDESKSFVSKKLAVKHTQSSGRGVYAAETIKPRENLVKIPPLHLLNSTTVIAHIAKHNLEISLAEPYYHSLYVPQPVKDEVGEIYSGLSVELLLELLGFQLISTYLILEKSRGASSFWKPFIDMLPDVLELSMAPIVWKILGCENCETLWKTLPRSARKHSEQVISRFEKDFETVKAKLPQLSKFLDRSDFLWAWMCINSRCLYMDMPQAKDDTDNFTMAPYVDFLNHSSDDQCGIKIDTLGFHVVTSCSYESGCELYFSYGPHSNEFLLCEYGFALPENKWNFVDLTDYVVPLFRPKHADFLKKIGYYGEYTVNSSGMSFRTEIALAVLQEEEPEASRKLKAFVDGVSDGSVYSAKLKVLLDRILHKLVGDSERRLEEGNNFAGETGKRMEAILDLHRDIRDICKLCLSGE